MTGPVLIAVEDGVQRKRLAEMLLAAGYRIIDAESGYRALELLRRRRDIMLALVSLEMSDIREVDFIASIRAAGIATALIALVTHEDDTRLKRALAAGARDFLSLPASPLRLNVSVGNLLHHVMLEHRLHLLQQNSGKIIDIDDFVARSALMQHLIKAARAAAQDMKPLLVIGEAGTRPELLAHAIHHQAKNAAMPFIPVSCSATLDKDLSAGQWLRDIGKKLHAAKEATVFFNDIDMLDMDLQNGLLALLRAPAAKHIRLMASASASLAGRVRDGSFSAGLWQFIAQSELEIPPLRTRREDIPELVERILAQILMDTGKARITGVAGAAQALLLQHDWPNNHAELEALLYRAVLLSEGPLLGVHDFPQLLQNREETVHETGPENDLQALSTQPSLLALDESGHILSLAQMEKELIREAMKRYNGRISEVARRLKIGRSTLYRKLEEYDLVEKPAGG
ncbi:MAG: Sigma-54-dependent Fis family transcriptional regulator [Candidatus Tokpelaia hoelldobleri]|uniref:DNA-binding transcriptional regulator NtrC n=1 Tax=Candidatus Tokpelaia hoelldobleri TaxID=1902579 RepID=A0A1U9JTC4_9HYPH|nr:MAG: Sigma-54-dependent Fis family transcriptional regulator [Candidatus Tokpelaia hoelldoblerii]